MSSLIWKVCGLKDSKNIEDVSLLRPDFLGFIFYPNSPRFAEPDLDSDLLKSLSFRSKKVGVFVNEDSKHILSVCEKYGLDYAQLHGEESSSFCKTIRDEGILVIKVFSIDQSFDFAIMEEYERWVDFFLFDTKGELPGGNSFPFDWQLLHKYKLKTPFLLSGGISLVNISGIQDIKHPMLVGIDVNSRFEIEPGFKDVNKLRDLKQFIEEYDHKKYE